MSTSYSASPSSVSDGSSIRHWVGTALFFVVAAIGLYWAKWDPYYHKTFTAFAKHSIGTSIITGKHAVAEAPSWHAAWDYSLAYFNAIYKALIVAVILGSLVQVLVPKDWMRRLMGSKGFGSTLAGGIAALPGMMCTCCSTPLVVGMRKNSSSVGAAVAFWLGSTALNPSVLIFMTLVLSWKFTVLRIALGLILVFGVGHLANRIGDDNTQNALDIMKFAEKQQTTVENGTLAVRWFKSIGKMLIVLIPPYIVSVLVLGVMRAWLFPAIPAAWSNSVVVMLLFALAGTLFVIPTAGEIPVVQTLQSFGLGFGPAAALMFSLPVISLPSMLMVRRVLSTKVLVFLAASVVVLSFVGALIAALLF